MPKKLMKTIIKFELEDSDEDDNIEVIEDEEDELTEKEKIDIVKDLLQKMKEANLKEYEENNKEENK